MIPLAGCMIYLDVFYCVDWDEFEAFMSISPGF